MSKAASLTTLRYRMIDNPYAPFALIVNPDGTLHTGWPEGELALALRDGQEDPYLEADLARRLEAYFGGEAVDFLEVPLPPAGDFTRRCWEACRQIPRGKTISYAQLASDAGAETAATSARPAGQAMRRNLLPIIVPCHRVLATGGSLHGFSGSVDPEGAKLTLKRTLLEMEGAIPATDSPSLFASLSG